MDFQHHAEAWENSDLDEALDIRINVVFSLYPPHLVSWSRKDYFDDSWIHSIGGWVLSSELIIQECLRSDTEGSALFPLHPRRSFKAYNAIISAVGEARVLIVGWRRRILIQIQLEGENLSVMNITLLDTDEECFSMC